MVKTASEVTSEVLSRYRDRGLSDATAAAAETDLFFSVAKARARWSQRDRGDAESDAGRNLSILFPFLSFALFLIYLVELVPWAI